MQDHFIRRPLVDRDLHVALAGDQVLAGVVIAQAQTWEIGIDGLIVTGSKSWAIT